MKIINLLNKIANNEKVPNKVRYGAFYWEYNEENKDYRDNDDDYVFSCSNYDIIHMLNEDVEIIEEDNKIKKIKELNCVGNSSDIGEFKDKQHLNNHILKDKINELIDKVNKLGE